MVVYYDALQGSPEKNGLITINCSGENLCKIKKYSDRKEQINYCPFLKGHYY